jgi:hypothetical protein
MVKSQNKNVKRLNIKQKRALVQLSVAQKQQVVLFVTQKKEMRQIILLLLKNSSAMRSRHNRNI